jgi:hypothetical protein
VASAAYTQVKRVENPSALAEKYLQEIKPLQDQLYRKRGELRLSWLQTKPDRSKINYLQKDVPVNNRFGAWSKERNAANGFLRSIGRMKA